MGSCTCLRKELVFVLIVTYILKKFSEDFSSLYFRIYFVWNVVGSKYSSSHSDITHYSDFTWPFYVSVKYVNNGSTSPLRTDSQNGLKKKKRTLATYYTYWSFCSTINLYRSSRCDFMTACTDDFDAPFSCNNHFKCFHAFNCDRVPYNVCAEITRRVWCRFIINKEPLVVEPIKLANYRVPPSAGFPVL